MEYHYINLVALLVSGMSSYKPHTEGLPPAILKKINDEVAVCPLGILDQFIKDEDLKPHELPTLTEHWYHLFEYGRQG